MLLLFLRLLPAGALLTDGKSRLVCFDEDEDPEDEADPLFSTNLELIKFPPNLPPAPPPCCSGGVPEAPGSRNLELCCGLTSGCDDSFPPASLLSGKFAGFFPGFPGLLLDSSADMLGL